MSGNIEKQQRYIELKKRLTKALRGEFWFEACMIEYAIIEDRTASILFHSGVCNDPYKPSKKLSNKLNSIEYQIGKGHKILSKKFEKELINSIRKWKDNRNDLVHRACLLYDEANAKEVALEGDKLVKSISNASARVTRYANRINGNDSGTPTGVQGRDT